MRQQNSHEGRVASPEVLGRLLVFQQAIGALPDEARIAEFARKTLLDVPGVRDAYVHLRGHASPPNREMEEVLAQYEQRTQPSAALDLLKTNGAPGVQVFPIETPVNKFGMLLLQVSDETLLKDYVAFLSNISYTISHVLESRLFAAQLAQVNEELRQVCDELEDRVTERTRELEYHVTHDPLTGCPNRVLLIDRMHQAIARAQGSGCLVCVVYIDLDSFTFVNTGMGTACGDKLLEEMGRRLGSLVRDGDTVARVGSDEFVLLLGGLENPERSSARLRALLAAVREPLKLDDKELVVTCSAGACFYPLDGDDAEILLRRANSAMHRAKASGKDNLQFYADARDAPIAERMQLETDLRQAISAGGLVLYYQPKLELATGRFAGCEVLVRWVHPARGLLPPSQFIPIAEESTLIVNLGEWVLMQACLQARIWHEAGIEGAAVAVNLAARQFRNGSIVDTVRNVLRDTGLDPGRLELEITESSVMHDIKQTTRLMHDLKQLGVSIGIDDFGTGYSSLSALRSFPLDKLKIDRSFVNEIETVPNAAAVALAVISFAKRLGLRVIAEGVETEGQGNFLKEHGCDEIQGYLIARPLPAAEVQQMLSSPYTGWRPG
jgi:diguanylate cyclase (GGDEF)-like protein